MLNTYIYVCEKYVTFQCIIADEKYTKEIAFDWKIYHFSGV